ncbi:flagellar basal-body rod modification protein FlgD [Sphingomonas gellani]|uniref:Basal-body rod modification protein FlgD n=1 Tax=Sphingomonas gellani TaxID=1166340 RepID=A0A1H8CJW0_9SPHN|nr:flagellar hook capping FlgD N-terminal domain-containing protein [Sphingomonas gellani]SEM95571.1 flagellar basal-body rod modification protein FlgD [Sphingomonas gellani]
MTTATASSLITPGVGTTNNTNAAAAIKNSKTTLDQSDFLTLMTAQLKNQDPFNPTDNTQMIAQMAQFSSVAGISEMNTKLSAIATKLGGTSATDAMAYVGKTVLTEGTTAYGRTTGGIAGAVELDKDATDVDVTISDAGGNILKTIKLGNQKAGTASYDWNGTTDSGEKAGSGPFAVTVAAANGGTTVKSRGLVWAPVESVSLPATGDPTLQVSGIGAVALSAVRSAG